MLEDFLHFDVTQRPELMHEADSQVELRKAGDSLLDAGHADQDHACRLSDYVGSGTHLVKAGFGE